MARPTTRSSSASSAMPAGGAGASLEQDLSRRLIDGRDAEIANMLEQAEEAPTGPRPIDPGVSGLEYTFKADGEWFRVVKRIASWMVDGSPRYCGFGDLVRMDPAVAEQDVADGILQPYDKE